MTKIKLDEIKCGTPDVIKEEEQKSLKIYESSKSIYR